MSIDTRYKLVAATGVLILALAGAKAFAQETTTSPDGQTVTITVPAGTKVVTVDSTHCEPIYNEHTGSLYVPRCWHLKQKEKEAGPVERIFDRSVTRAGEEVEQSVQNGIDRVIYDLGKKIEKATCSSGC